MGSKYVPKEIKKPVDKVIDFFDEDILDPAGEFLEEQILDPAGEFLGEELAQPLRRQVSKAMPDELQFLAGIGGGKAGAMMAALATGNPFLIAAAAAAGNVAGDYLTTEVDEEYDPDVVSAAFSAVTQGLAAAEEAKRVKHLDIEKQLKALGIEHEKAIGGWRDQLSAQSADYQAQIAGLQAGWDDKTAAWNQQEVDWTNQFAQQPLKQETEEKNKTKL